MMFLSPRARHFFIRDEKHRREYAAKRLGAEEAFAAGSATVRGESEKPLQKNQRAFIHAFAQDDFQIKIAAPRAVRISGKGESHEPGVKALVADVASPGSQPHQRAGEIEYAGAVRTMTVRTPAPRADHFLRFTPPALPVSICETSSGRNICSGPPDGGSEDAPV
jgi:hypothetical protein